MKFVKLLTAAYVSGTLRHPHEGVLTVEDAEADRLVGDKAAEDVSDDFSAKQERDATAQSITVASGGAPAPAPANPHQAEVETDEPEPAHTPSRRRAAAHKE